MLEQRTPQSVSVAGQATRQLFACEKFKSALQADAMTESCAGCNCSSPATVAN